MILERPRIGLRLEGVSVHLGGRPVLKEVDLRIEPEALTCILGPNGAGKTTLLKVAAGLLRPSKGNVYLGERPLPSIARGERARMMTFGGVEPPPAFAWTALELALMGRAPHLGRALEEPEDLGDAERALEMVGAEELARRVITELSAGERQRVYLARVVCQDTPVMLLDEPTCHQDPARAMGMAETLKGLAADGHTVVAVVHDVNLAARYADRLVLVADGRITTEGSAEEVLGSDALAEAYGVHVRRIPGTPPAVVLEPPRMG